MLRAGLVKNCRRCKSSVRLNCVYRKKIRQKTFSDNKKKGEKAQCTSDFSRFKLVLFLIFNKRGEKMQRTLHETKCSECNQVTLVPFKPTPGKPVYCKTCFAKRLTKQPTRTNMSHAFEPKQAWARRRQSQTVISQTRTLEAWRKQFSSSSTVQVAILCEETSLVFI